MVEAFNGLVVYLDICFTAMPGRSCFSGGRTYVNGESFDIGCKVKCTCIDGYLGCMPKCPLTITASAPKVSRLRFLI